MKQLSKLSPNSAPEQANEYVDSLGKKRVIHKKGEIYPKSNEQTSRVELQSIIKFLTGLNLNIYIYIYIEYNLIIVKHLIFIQHRCFSLIYQRILHVIIMGKLQHQLKKLLNLCVRLVNTSRLI